MIKIGIEDELYPNNLRKIKNPPKVIYAKGNIELLNKNGIAVVGSRNCTEYGKSMTLKFSHKLSKKGLVIISGMAIGTDSYAHIGAIKGSGETIAVLPSGFNNIYPGENIKLYNKILDFGGCVITEYAPDAQATTTQFVKRNRIVSGLAIGTLIIEGGHRSGTRITARLTKEQEKPIFCIPSNLDSSKSLVPNKLIQEGNFLVTCVEDILNKYPKIDFKPNKQIKFDANDLVDDLNVYKSVDTRTDVNEKYKDVYEIIGEEPIHINEIIKKTQLDISDISYKLTMLELQGNISAFPRQDVSKKIKDFKES